MWIPLYETPIGNPRIDKNLRIGEPPVYSDNNTVVTVALKHWISSNGQPITARDVILWMNRRSAVSDRPSPSVGSRSEPGSGWGESVPGLFPQNVVSYTQTGTYTVAFHLNASYHPTWYSDNELTQIWPIPTTAAEARTFLPANSTPICPNFYVPVNPETATSGALGVAEFLNSQSQGLATDATNPLWQVVSGSFKLSPFTSDGYVKMVPNTNYSGTPQPTIGALEEFPLSSDASEFNALRSRDLTIGYVPPSDIHEARSVEKEEGYSRTPRYFFGIAVLPFNYTNPPIGPMFERLYFRRALQSLIDQPQYIKAFDVGIGTVDNGAIPTFPRDNPDATSAESKGQLNPFESSKAVSLLNAHGWSVHPDGTTTCHDPGTAANQCGAGVKANPAASFSLLYANGSAELLREVARFQSSLKAKAGITLTINSASAPDVFSRVFTSCTFANPCSGWDIADWAPASLSPTQAESPPVRLCSRSGPTTSATIRTPATRPS